MNSLRYSVNSLLLGIANIVLLLSSMVGTWGDEKSTNIVSRGGLGLCTLFFSLLCAFFELSAQRTLILIAVFYAWGQSCLLLTEAFDLNIFLRIFLAIAGAAFAAWVWLTPGDLVPNPARPGRHVNK